MALHHKIKPHHHISIWAVSALLLAVMFGLYTTTARSLAEDGPSQKTKEFFGAEDEGPREYNPPECQQKSEQEIKMDSLNAQMTEVSNQMNQLSQQMQGTTDPEQIIALQAQMTTLQAKQQELSNQMNSLSAEMQKQTTWQPSDACKQALVNIVKTDMAGFKSKINNSIMGTFGKVNAAIAKIEAKLPALKEAGVDPTIIKRIESDIQTIKTNEAILKGFFQKMVGFIDSFLALANSNPIQAFEKMQQNFGDGGDYTDAAKAADTLVAAFEDLEKAVSQLK